MIFVGDISLPFKNAINLVNFSTEFFEKHWIGNLEGALVDNSAVLSEQLIVYNDIEAIKELNKKFKFSAFLLANNHILDCGTMSKTIGYLDELGIPSIGIGDNITSSSFPLVIESNGSSFLLLNFGWEVIQCEVAKKNNKGVNPLIKEHVINSFNEVKSNYPEAKIVVTFHWNYELEAYPQPRERELAKYLIDNGAAAIIGGHPHRIGGFELYKNKPIIYSLGNWMFAQNYYNKGRLRFPDFCNKELAFELDLENNKLTFHFFEYNREKSTLKYLRSEDDTSNIMNKLSPFRGLDDKSYRDWYSQNRYHKRKGLPVYYWNDTIKVIKIKNRIVKFRDYLIKLIINSGLKK